MRHPIVTSFVSGLLASILLAGPATAQEAFDHFKCYKVKDGQKFKQAFVDLTPLTSPPFPLEAGCKLVGKAKKLCTPVAKVVTETDAQQLAITGDDQTTDFICYKIKCPKIEVPDVQTADQFGGRFLSKLKAQELCVPTGGSGTVTTTTVAPTTTILPQSCTDLGSGVCGGTCPNSGSCLWDPFADECGCTPSECDFIDVQLGAGEGFCAGNCGISGGDCVCDPGGICAGGFCVSSVDCPPGAGCAVNNTCVGGPCDAHSDCPSPLVCLCPSGAACMCQ